MNRKGRAAKAKEGRLKLEAASTFWNGRTESPYQKLFLCKHVGIPACSCKKLLAVVAQSFLVQMVVGPVGIIAGCCSQRRHCRI